MSRPCTIAGCERPHASRGLCHMHYVRKRRNGTTDTIVREQGTGSYTDGYLIVGRDRKMAHVIVAERALGRPLPVGAQVHHVNETKDDNRPQNLVICPDGKYHALLHVRARALSESGNADYRKCCYCKRYDDPACMRQRKGKEAFYHQACHAAYYRVFQANKRRKLKCQQS